MLYGLNDLTFDDRLEQNMPEKRYETKYEKVVKSDDTGVWINQN